MSGVKQYCSGARSCTDALITAAAPDGDRLFAVSTRWSSLCRAPGRPPVWLAATRSTSDSVAFRPSRSAESGSYVSPAGLRPRRRRRRGLLVRGARAVGYALASAAANRDIGPHALAHLGAVDIALRSAKAALDDSAAEIDADPLDHKSGGRALALRVRALVEATATEVMHRVGRSLGAGPLSHDESHGRRVADLTVYLRQHHAERNLAELGAIVAESGGSW